MGEGHEEMKVEIDWGDASTSRRTPKVVGSPLKGGSRHGTDSSLQPSERTIILPAPLFQTSASRTPRQCIFTGSAPQSVILCCSGPSKVTT